MKRWRLFLLFSFVIFLIPSFLLAVTGGDETCGHVSMPLPLVPLSETPTLAELDAHVRALNADHPNTVCVQVTVSPIGFMAHAFPRDVPINRCVWRCSNG